MQPASGAGKRDLPVLACGGIPKPGHQIRGQERCIRGDCHNVRNPTACRPVKSRQDTCQRTCVSGDRIGENREAEFRKPRFVTVGIQCQFVHLGRSPFDHVFQHRPVTDGQKALVATSHATRQAARQYGA